VAIQHEAVGCVVAGKYPKLDACLAPEDQVGHAQIQFRSRADQPWWAVDLHKEGGCHSTLLPMWMGRMTRPAVRRVDWTRSTVAPPVTTLT